MEVKNVRVSVRRNMVVLTWQHGGVCHMVKSEADGTSVQAVLRVANDLLGCMEADPDGSKMLGMGR